jgi:hypothetical protein
MNRERNHPPDVNWKPGNAHLVLFLKKAGFLFLFVVSHLFILNNFFLFSKDLLYGDLSAQKIIPVPQYGFSRISNTRLFKQSGANNRLAIDFAQIYFPAKEFEALIENYRPGDFDPLARPSRYAPLVHYLCKITFCKLDYGYASLFHILLQLFLFYIFFILAFFVLKIERDLLFGIFLVNIYLFLTPAGLSWFERGQFSLYVAVSYLLIILGVFKKNIFFILLAALFAFIKWTSFPYIAIVIAIFLFTSQNRKEVMRNLRFIAAFSIVVISLLAVFPEKSIYFIEGLYYQERFAVPDGISLARLLPIGIAKFLPFALILLGLLQTRINRKELDKYTPYLIGAGILMVTYPTLAYEYSVACLFCFIPFLFYWAKLPDVTMNFKTRVIMKFSFLLFLFLASYSNQMNLLFGTEFIVFVEYIFVAAVFLLVPLVFDAFASKRVAQKLF